MWTAEGMRFRSRGGFTLLEVLVALAILSVMLLTMYQGFTSTVNIDAATRNLWRAIVFVNNELARVERGPSPSVSIQQGTFPTDDPMSGFAWRREVTDEEPFPGVRVRKVLLELTWETGGTPQSYRSQIYVPAH